MLPLASPPRGTPDLSVRLHVPLSGLRLVWRRPEGGAVRPRGSTLAAGCPGMLEGFVWHMLTVGTRWASGV